MEESKSIRVFHTHIEISPYFLGECPRLEKLLSTWIDATHSYDPIAYLVYEGVLYVPRGVSIDALEKFFNATAYIIRAYDEYDNFPTPVCNIKAKDRIQEEAFQFLTATGKFSNRASFSQFALILPPGDGKTVIATYAITQMHCKTLIITHQEKIKEQWIKTILNLTSIDEKHIMDISSASDMQDIIDRKKSAYVYLVNHQTLSSFVRAYDYQKLRIFFRSIRVGLKIYDEAHLEFRNIAMLDMFSNVKRTIYLTATFKRSDVKEQAIFKRVFSSTTKYGEETQSYEERRKHIVYMPILYRSNPSMYDIMKTKNKYGFSTLNFTKYALHEDKDNTMINILSYVYNQVRPNEGKILITISRIDDTDYIKDYLKEHFPDDERTIAVINSNNTAEENEQARNADVICSTIRSCGTGVDLKGLRYVINMEAYSSDVIAEQLSGRLREYAPDKDTYLVDLVDIAFPACEKQYERRLKVFKKKCKEIKPIVMRGHL